MKDDYVSRDLVNKEIGRFTGHLDNDLIIRLKTAINKLPNVHIKKGEWIREQSWVKAKDNDDEIVLIYPQCSKCGFVATWGSPYCPNCGAKMTEKGGIYAQ